MRMLVKAMFISMSSKAIRVVFLILCCAHSAWSAVLLEDTQLVAASPALAQVAPQARTFSITTAGTYRVTLSDVSFPSPLTSMNLVISRGIKSVARLTKAGSVDFDAVPGDYIVRVLGTSATAGTLAVKIAVVDGSATLLQYSAGVIGGAASIPLNQSSLSEKLAIAAAGIYTVAVTDQTFPEALQSFDLIVLDTNGMPLARVCKPANPPICASGPVSFTAAVGSYDLFSTAHAATPGNAGLYSINVDGGPANTTVLAATYPVGILKAHAEIDLPADDQYTLLLGDLQFPAALNQMHAAVTQRGKSLLSISSGSGSFNAVSGAAVVYSMVAPPANGTGTFSLQVQRATQSIYSDIKVSTDTATSVHAFNFTTTLPTNGLYRFRLKDFAFPASLASLQMLITQGTTLIGTFSGVGATDARAGAGPVNITVLASSPSVTLGMFSVAIDAPANGSATRSIVYETTQGVGELFQTRVLTVHGAGNLDIELADLGLPIAFSDLALAVTQGNTIVGQIFGGGKFSFAATPGDYALNFIARGGSTAQALGYGLYGVQVADSPPMPTLTLTASATTVMPQGTTDLTWTSANATSCVASGGWSGARDVTGTAKAVGPFATNTTLTLTCNGPGGSISAAANIAVAEPAQDKGSGSIDSLLLGALFLLMTCAASRRK